MEFLFTNKIVTIEVILLLICVGILVSFLIYGLYQYIRRLLEVMYPKRPAINPLENPLSQESAPPLMVDTPVQSDTHPGELPQTAESVTLSPLTSESPEEEKPQEVVLDNPILYNEDGSPISTEMPLASYPQADTSSVTSTGEVSSSGSSEPGLMPENSDREAPEEEKKSPESSHDIGLPPDTLPEESQKEDLSVLHESHDTPPISNDVPPAAPRDISPSKQNVSQASEGDPAEGKKGKKAKSADKIIDILSQVRTLIARGQPEEARALIVSGLALEKDHRDLNLLMATLYERDRAYKKAEYVLKDIALKYPDDTEILSHLATVLALQRKYDVSYELYKKILVIGGENEEILYTLIHLSSELSLADDVLLYARSYLKRFPHNPEILWLYAQSLITAGERKQAVETLIKLKNLTPYNQEIADLIQKLMTEEELAGNFGGDKA